MTAAAASTFGRGTKSAYWIGQSAEGLASTSIQLFLLFYYNQVLGLSGTLCGIALVLATIVDAITDPYMGSVSDGWRSKWGRRHPFMYGAALPLALFIYLIFNPLVDSQIGLFTWMLGFSVLMRLGMTLYVVPYMALGAEMTSDYNERNVIIAGRLFFGVLGSLLVYWLGFGVFFGASEDFQNGQLNPAAYPPYGLLMAVLVALTILVSAIGTHSLIPRLRQPQSRNVTSAKTAARDMLDALDNASFRWLVLGFVLVSAPVGIGAALGLYMMTFFWDLTPTQIVIVLASAPIGNAIGYALTPLASLRMEKRQLLISGALGWVVFALAPVCLHYAGFFPELGTSALAVGLTICSFFAGLVVSQVMASVSSMLADVADEQELFNGKRQEGVFYGAFSFVIKATNGLGAAVGGFALDLIHWPVGKDVLTRADVAGDTLFSLAMIAGPGLGTGLLPAIWCFSHYSLDRKRHLSILSEIQTRSSASS